MKTYKYALRKKIAENLGNHYEEENHDVFRFGKYENFENKNILKIKNVIKKVIKHNLTNYVNQFSRFDEKINQIWNKLSEDDQKLLISILAFRALGSEKIKLPLNTPEYWNAIETAIKLEDKSDTYDPHFMHFILSKFNLNPIGYNIELYFSEIAIAIDFIIEQYAYKRNGENLIQVEKNDYVIDAGGCWGDTALYFAHKTGENGKVFTFEFIPDNIKLFNINLNFNPELKKRIQLIPNPVSNKSNQDIYFKDFGPGSQVKMEPFEQQTGQTKTISIDDFVFQNNIEKVDFIKMDIEGAEPIALEGAIETIKKFKPKLAIAIYHSMEDFVNIPTWILDLNLGYEIFLGHYTIHAEETVIFAKAK